MFKYLLTKFKTQEFDNIKHLLISHLFKYILSLCINIWIVRGLGEENFGLFSYITSLTGIFSIISTFGLQTVVVTSILSNLNYNEDKVISNAFILSVITGFVAAIAQISFVLLYNLNEQAVINLCLINLLIYGFDTFKILTYYYEANVQSSKVAKINNISFLICTLFRVLILFKGLGLYFLAFSYVLDYIITSFLLYYIFPKNIFRIDKIRFDKQMFLFLIKKSLPLLFSGLFISFFMKIDLIMIKNLLNNKQAGIFASSVRLTEIWYFIPGVLQSTFFPSLFQSKENLEEYKIKIIRLYKLMIYFSLSIIFLTLVFGKFIITNLFGIGYIEAFEPLKIHIWSLLFVSISVIRNSKLFALGLTKIFFQITLIGAVLNFILCYLFILNFGIIGASFATVFSYFIIAYGLNLFYKDLRGEIININTSFATLFNKSIR